MAERWKEEKYDRLPGPQRPAIVAHCSVNDMVTQYKTASSVALCWLHQVLDADPTLIRHLRNKYDEGSQETSDDLPPYICDWEDRIVDLWQEVISAVAKEVGFLVFIADGMDKCDDPHALPDLVNWVAEAARKAVAVPGGTQFQILVFSNDTEELRSLSRPPVHHLTTESFLPDIECAVKDRVNAVLRRYASDGELQEDQGQQHEGEDQQDGETRGGADSKLRTLLWRTILNGEEKTHLWAAVLMGEIKAAKFPDKASLVDFLDFLNDSSDGGKLDALYGVIVRRISSGRELKRHSFNVLFWVMHKIGAMTKQELQHGCGMLDAAGFGGAGFRGRVIQRRTQEADVERTYLDHYTFRRALENCGGLVTAWSRGLCLIHDSFRDYFTKRADQAIHRDYHSSPEKAAGILSDICQKYLTSARFEHAGPPAAEQETCEWEDKVHNRLQENKLVRYASLRWTEHLQRSGSVFEPDHTSHKRWSRIRRLLDPEKGYFRSWTEVLWYWTKAAEGVPYPKERFPWELFVRKNSIKHWLPEQKLPPPRFPPPSFGNPDPEPPPADSGHSNLEQPGSGHLDLEQPALEHPTSDSPEKGTRSQQAWWRKKWAWFVVLALVIIIISGTVGGIVGSQRSRQNDRGQRPGAAS
jgi:hypothetical protein